MSCKIKYNVGMHLVLCVPQNGEESSIDHTCPCRHAHTYTSVNRKWPGLPQAKAKRGLTLPPTGLAQFALLPLVHPKSLHLTSTQPDRMHTPLFITSFATATVLLLLRWHLNHSNATANLTLPVCHLKRQRG